MQTATAPTPSTTAAPARTPAQIDEPGEPPLPRYNTPYWYGYGEISAPAISPRFGHQRGDLCVAALSTDAVCDKPYVCVEFVRGAYGECRDMVIAANKWNAPTACAPGFTPESVGAPSPVPGCPLCGGPIECVETRPHPFRVPTIEEPMVTWPWQRPPPGERWNGVVRPLAKDWLPAASRLPVARDRARGDRCDPGRGILCAEHRDCVIGGFDGATILAWCEDRGPQCLSSHDCVAGTKCVLAAARQGGAFPKTIEPYDATCQRVDGK